MNQAAKQISGSIVVAVATIAGWLALVAVEQIVGRGGILQILYLTVLALCSAGYWRVNRALALRFRSPEAGILLLAALSAVLTALTLVAGAAAAAPLSAWLTAA